MKINVGTNTLQNIYVWDRRILLMKQVNGIKLTHTNIKISGIPYVIFQ